MTDNLMGFQELACALHAGRFSFSGKNDSGFSSVCIDSREALPGSLFTALKGQKTDGHCFVRAAFAAGAPGALVTYEGMKVHGLEEAALSQEKELIAVDDTLRGLQDAAASYLKKFPRLKKVGITGSSGKTTTKEIAAAMAGFERRVVKNPGNLNSETGLPLAIFNVRKEHEVGVFELGMNRKGEIGELAGMLRPDIALITNIGTAHIGLLGGRDAIAEEKKQIFSRFSGTETALIPEEDPYADFLRQGVKGRVVFYGSRGSARSLGLDGTEISIEGETARFALPGRFNLADALAACAIARELGLSPAAMRRGLESVRPLFGRAEILRGPATVIRDCYNANPESFREALDFCDSLDWEGRKIYVAGAMLELGAASEEAHRELGRRLAASEADEVYLYGEETLPALGELERSPSGTRFFYTSGREELKKLLADTVREGDLILLKGSRGCALENLTDIVTLGGRA